MIYDMLRDVWCMMYDIYLTRSTTIDSSLQDQFWTTVEVDECGDDGLFASLWGWDDDDGSNDSDDDGHNIIIILLMMVEW